MERLVCMGYRVRKWREGGGGGEGEGVSIADNGRNCTTLFRCAYCVS